MTLPAAGRVASDSLPAVLPSRAVALFAAAIPSALALAFWPTLQSAFLLPKNAVLVAATGMLALVVLLSRTPIPIARNATQRQFLIATTAFLFALLVSAAASGRPELAAQPLLIAVSGCVLMPMAAAALRGRSEWMMAAIALSGFAVASLAIANRFGFDVFTPFGLHPNDSGGRMQIASTLGNPNFVASYVSGCVPALLNLALQRNPRGWVARVGLATSFAAVWFTQSRIGMVCFFVALLIPLLPRARANRFFTAALLALFVASAIYVNSTNPRSLPTAASGRMFLWRVSLSDGIHLLGEGPGTFYYVHPERLGRWFAGHPDPSLLRFADMQTHAHNDFLEFLVSTGVLGAVALVAALALGIASLAKSPHAPFAFAGFAAIVLSACFDFPLQRAETWALLWLWMSFVFLDASSTTAFQTNRRLAFPLAIVTVVAFAIALAPAVASYHVHEGLAWEAQAGDADAVKEYSNALAWDRTNADGQFYLARALANADHGDAALAQTQFAQHWVDEPELWEVRARILTRQGRKQEALDVLDSALQRFPYASGLAAARAEIAAEPPS